MDESKRYEGSLRASVSPSGKDAYWCEFETYGVPNVQKIERGVSLDEARIRATHLEQSWTQQEIARRKYNHIETPARERRMVGELSETTIGRFLLQEFDLDLATLTADQRAEYNLTVLKMHSPQPYSVSGKELSTPD